MNHQPSDPFPRLRTAYPVVLASSSPQRQELLGRLLDDFAVAAPGIEENLDAADPFELVRSLAERKAEAVAGRVDGASIFIAADTIAWCAGRIIGKPADTDEAVRLLMELSRTPHSVLTGLCVRWPGGQALDAVETRIWMRPLSRQEAARFAMLGGATDRAGAYAIQEQADEFVERLEGSLTNVIGLPLERLAEILLAVPGTVRKG